MHKPKYHRPVSLKQNPDECDVRGDDYYCNLNPKAYCAHSGYDSRKLERVCLPRFEKQLALSLELEEEKYDPKIHTENHRGEPIKKSDSGNRNAA